MAFRRSGVRLPLAPPANSRAYWLIRDRRRVLKIAGASLGLQPWRDTPEHCGTSPVCPLPKPPRNSDPGLMLLSRGRERACRPRRVRLLTGAFAVVGYFSVQSSPVRVSSLTCPRSSRACMRYPSSLISCAHKARLQAWPRRRCIQAVGRSVCARQSRSVA